MPMELELEQGESRRKRREMSASGLRLMRRWWAGALVGATLLLAPWARAADPADVAAAEALFLEGRDLMAEGRYDEACAKFAESQRLDPGTGTAINLAECYEKQGRRATAWGTWLEAANLARQAGQADREEYARSRAKSAEAQLHRLVIVVPEASRVEGLRVTRSGVEIRPGAWGAALPVDPGDYEIEVTAPGKVAYRTVVSI